MSSSASFSCFSSTKIEEQKKKEAYLARLQQNSDTDFLLTSICIPINPFDPPHIRRCQEMEMEEMKIAFYKPIDWACPPVHFVFHRN